MKVSCKFSGFLVIQNIRQNIAKLLIVLFSKKINRKNGITEKIKSLYCLFPRCHLLYIYISYQIIYISFIYEYIYCVCIKLLIIKSYIHVSTNKQKKTKAMYVNVCILGGVGVGMYVFSHAISTT